MERYIAIKQVSYQEEVSIAGLNVLSLRLFESEKNGHFVLNFLTVVYYLYQFGQSEG